jgi:hypothetical protein
MLSRIKQDRSAIYLIQFHHNRSDTQATIYNSTFFSGHLSSLSKTPSPSVSGQGQPAFSFGPATVGHLSSLSAIPSLSVSGHLSMQLNQIRLDKHHLYQQRTPSVSGQPFNAAKPNIQHSALS